MKKRVLVADDHEGVRSGIKALLEKDFAVCGECSNGKDAVEKAVALRPDLVVLDVNMPTLNGIEASRLTRRFVPKTKILMLSLHDTSQLELAAEAAGADDFLSKASAPEELIEVVNQLMRGATGPGVLN